MAASMKRLEFKQRYVEYVQGLFILPNEKRFPKEQPVVNLGKELSERLMPIPKEGRPNAVTNLLDDIIQPYRSVSLTHLEVLFTDYLKLDVLRSLLSLCRNRKICIVWPGNTISGRFIYATPERPEYYECDPANLQDTYIITE